MNKNRSNIAKANGVMDKEVRFGVIGLGGMGLGHCHNLARVPHAGIAAVCDVGYERSEEAGRTFRVPFFTDHRQMIASRLCNAVIIATPHPFHLGVTLDCMNAGLHVLCEKPISERVSAADQMIGSARRNKVAFAVMFQRRLEPVMMKAMEIVRSGQLGCIYRATLISPEYRNQFYYDSGVWRATWKGEGGGVMMNQSPHMVDIFLQLCGMPVEVLGRVETRSHCIEVEDQAEAMLRFPEGGIGYVYCSTCEAGPGQMIEIFGDRGKLILRDEKLSFYRFEPTIRMHMKNSRGMWNKPEVKEEPLRIHKARGNLQVKVISNFVRHLLFNEPLVTPGESTMKSLELANAIMLSSYKNRWTKIPINRKEYDDLLSKLQRSSKFKRQKMRAYREIPPFAR